MFRLHDNKHLLRQMSEDYYREKMEEQMAEAGMDTTPFLVSPTGEHFRLDDLVIRATPREES
jgi:hypothetical protein